MRVIFGSIGLLFTLSLMACAEIGERDLPPPRVYVPQAVAPASVPDGSIFSNAGQSGLLSQERARSPGDLLTVLIEEDVSATSTSSATASRGSATTALTVKSLAGIDKYASKLGLPWAGDVAPGSSTIKSTGSGNADQTGTIRGSVTAVVTEVLPNGTLAIRGYKRMQLARGSTIVRVTGFVRPVDIQPDNTLRSRRLADAEITFAGTGELADAARSGWMNRALLRIWPF